MAVLSACGPLPAVTTSLVTAPSCSCSSSSVSPRIFSPRNFVGAASAGRKIQNRARSNRGGWTSQFKGVVFRTVSTSSTNSRVSRLCPLSAHAALVQKVTAKELDDILTNQRTSPMIIDFYATWCGPCIVLAQQLEELAVEYGDDVRFLKVDTDEEHELASQMEIRGLPTMVFVSSDTEKLAIRTEGLLPTETIRKIIENEL